MNLPRVATSGVHHVGLTVPDIDATADFFVRLLGWSEVGSVPDYPATFVSDGTIMLTLWAARTSQPTAFNKDQNVGLHHLALRVESTDVLEALCQLLKQEKIKIEFEPETLKGGPARHMMCYVPGGIRIEFIHVPENS